LKTPSSSYLPKLKRRSKLENDIVTDENIKKTKEIDLPQIIIENDNIKIDLGS